MADYTLYGWDRETWRRAIVWAHADISVDEMANERKWSDFRAIRIKWLNAGGPFAGPSSNLVLTDG